MTFYQGLRIEIRNGYNNLEPEGNTKLVINMLRKLIMERLGKKW